MKRNRQEEEEEDDMTRKEGGEKRRRRLPIWDDQNLEVDVEETRLLRPSLFKLATRRIVRFINVHYHAFVHLARLGAIFHYQSSLVFFFFFDILMFVI